MWELMSFITFSSRIIILSNSVCAHTGQAVPQGSHVRLNLQTGEREVRLGEEQLKYWTEEHRWGSRLKLQSADSSLFLSL